MSSQLRSLTGQCTLPSEELVREVFAVGAQLSSLALFQSGACCGRVCKGAGREEQSRLCIFFTPTAEAGQQHAFCRQCLAVVLPRSLVCRHWVQVARGAGTSSKWHPLNVCRGRESLPKAHKPLFSAACGCIADKPVAVLCCAVARCVVLCSPGLDSQVDGRHGPSNAPPAAARAHSAPDQPLAPHPHDKHRLDLHSSRPCRSVGSAPSPAEPAATGCCSGVSAHRGSAGGPLA